ncbi:MAG: hypothetical protein SAL70_30715 [Scytonema sp. PMC 1070.18]|nr:hypothetical protein [Scytonema sp. PMC 1070.18]
MTYLDKLNPWCLVKLQPSMQNQVVARFRRRSDAECHLRVIRRLSPGVTYIIIFNPVLELQDQLAELGEKWT